MTMNWIKYDRHHITAVIKLWVCRSLECRNNVCCYSSSKWRWHVFPVFTFPIWKPYICVVCVLDSSVRTYIFAWTRDDDWIRPLSLAHLSNRITQWMCEVHGKISHHRLLPLLLTRPRIIQYEMCASSESYVAIFALLHHTAWKQNKKVHENKMIAFCLLRYIKYLMWKICYIIRGSSRIRRVKAYAAVWHIRKNVCFFFLVNEETLLMLCVCCIIEHTSLNSFTRVIQQFERTFARQWRV